MMLRSQVFTSNGTWTPPVGVTAAWIMMVAGGASGSAAGTLGGGGGAGEFCERVLIPVSGPIAVTIGVGGVGSTGSWANGTDTSVGANSVRASTGVLFTTNVWGEDGGGVGSVGTGSLVPGTRGAEGKLETNTFCGGNGGAAGSGGGSAGGRDVGSPGTPFFGLGGAAHPTGAGAGAASYFGAGGNGGDGSVGGTSPLATAYGASGGGASNGKVPGSGANGYAVIFWIAP